MPGHGAREHTHNLTATDLTQLPAEFHTLGHALLRLRDLAAPSLGRGDHIPIGRTRTPTTHRDHEADCADEPLVPDPTGEHVATNRQLRAYEAHRRRLRRHADEINDHIEQRDTTRKQQCTGPQCRRWIRKDARYCEHCGSPQMCTDQQAS